MCFTKGFLKFRNFKPKKSGFSSMGVGVGVLTHTHTRWVSMDKSVWSQTLMASCKTINKVNKKLQSLKKKINED